MAKTISVRISPDAEEAIRDEVTNLKFALRDMAIRRKHSVHRGDNTPIEIGAADIFRVSKQINFASYRRRFLRRMINFLIFYTVTGVMLISIAPLFHYSMEIFDSTSFAVKGLMILGIVFVALSALGITILGPAYIWLGIKEESFEMKLNDSASITYLDDSFREQQSKPSLNLIDTMASTAKI